MKLVSDLKTFWILITIAALLLAYDVYAFNSEKSGDTVSEVVGQLAFFSGGFSFICGFICGHIFWPQRVELK